jgi:hypothetical protein
MNSNSKVYFSNEWDMQKSSVLKLNNIIFTKWKTLFLFSAWYARLHERSIYISIDLKSKKNIYFYFNRENLSNLLSIIRKFDIFSRNLL